MGLSALPTRVALWRRGQDGLSSNFDGAAPERSDKTHPHPVWPADDREPPGSHLGVRERPAWWEASCP